MKVITYATKKDQYYDSLEDSCKKFGYELITFKTDSTAHASFLIRPKINAEDTTLGPRLRSKNQHQCYYCKAHGRHLCFIALAYYRLKMNLQLPHQYSSCDDEFAIGESGAGLVV